MKNYVSACSALRANRRSLALFLDSHKPHRSGLYLLGCFRPHCLHFFQLVGAIYSLALLVTFVDSGSFVIDGTFGTFNSFSNDVTFCIPGSFLNSVTFEAWDSFKLYDTVHKHDSFPVNDTFLECDSFLTYATF